MPSHSSDAATLHILLDGHPHAIPAGSTLADVVASLGHAPEAVSTAVNGAFVARPARATQRLAEGDQVLLFQPIVGG
ncbi:MAG: sulfur carrier protein ThiS [Rubrivivax sp.]|uniref:sulfur carrier protein ThiS n=1 Tax=Ottowia sp. TaxID=1898956 RepID=UPI0011D6F6EA|nr:sulfur carrier protein ThiS [Ottowia sp.]MCC6814412.1 sulfur carrier protein ThiS [Rubrivivax sp.]MCZ2089878.1 sulfur carrier protein ThiS [Burkholderiales bacterium]TXI20459.1 MAG: sulfur carrier protein ThiS [Ottowia sp.]HNR83500.1 sulfur carrier protein ThiS [Ottowia sp.]HNT84756.1 sulfur carrier protein ThiS [Ottowia sp.]